MAPSDDTSSGSGGTPVPPRGGKRKPNRPPSRPSGNRSSASGSGRAAADKAAAGKAGAGKAGAGKARAGKVSPAEQRRIARAQQRRKRQTLLAAGAIVVVVVVVAALIIIKVSGGGSGSTKTATAKDATAGNLPIATTPYNKMIAVPPSALAAAATNFKTGYPYPTPISGKPVNAKGKPEVLYIGAEYCPYCATERWPMVLALSKFGTFKGLTNIHSSSTDVYPSTQTFSFYKSTYTSKYINFMFVETETVAKKALQTPTAAEDKIISKYDSGQNIPFVYFNGKGYVSGAEYNPQLLHGKTFDQIANEIAAGKTSLASNVYADAGALVSNICAMTGGKPGSVCKAFPKQLTSS